MFTAFSEIETDEEFEKASHLVDDLIERKDLENLNKFIENRGENKKFHEALSTRDNAYRNLEELDVPIQIAKGNVAGIDGKKHKSKVELRKHALVYRQANDELEFLNNKIHRYRSLAARAAQAASTIRDERDKEAGTFLSYDRETIGNLRALGEFEIGSPEWHAQRSAGIGGSDVAKIMKSDPKYGVSDYREILRTKLGLIVADDSDVRNNLFTAAGRGNAWEEYIRQLYTDKHPEQNVAFCKTSWEGMPPHTYRHANFDGLLLNDEGDGVGVVEIKTGVHSPKWGAVENGIWGAPENYRKQVLWYALNGGMDHGVIVAVLDDYDYREYPFDMNDPAIQAECQEIIEATDNFWEEVLTNKKLLEEDPSALTNRRKGFAKTINMKTAAAILSAYRGDDEASTYVEVREAFSNIKQRGIPYTKEQNQEVLTSLYSEFDPATRTTRIVGIDLETSHASVRVGRIIETGVVELTPDGETKVLYSSLHGLPETAMKGIGAGATEIHRITGDMLQNVPPFEDPEVQKTLLQLLKGSVLVAHNATFEDNFLSVNLDGYAEAREAGEIRILDTKILTTNFMLDSKDNSLESFSEDNGIPYVGAHAATTDTMMMMKALWNFQKNLHENGKFVAAPASEEERAAALLQTSDTETDR